MATIKFYPFSEASSFFALPPQPASKYIPEWYRKQIGIVGGDEMIECGAIRSTIKKCMPIFDLITAGYIISAPCDIYLDATALDELKWSIPESLKAFESEMFALHGFEQYQEYPIDKNLHHKTVFRIFPFWSVGTEKGYSSLFIHPAHRDESPLIAFSAIVDTDSFVADGHLSFLVKKGFKGVISQGVPLVQVIPFKRDSWASALVSVDDANQVLRKQRLDAGSTFANAYKCKFRAKKEYK